MYGVYSVMCSIGLGGAGCCPSSQMDQRLQVSGGGGGGCGQVTS